MNPPCVPVYPRPPPISRGRRGVFGYRNTYIRHCMQQQHRRTACGHPGRASPAASQARRACIGSRARRMHRTRYPAGERRACDAMDAMAPAREPPRARRLPPPLRNNKAQQRQQRIWHRLPGAPLNVWEMSVFKQDERRQAGC